LAPCTRWFFMLALWFSLPSTKTKNIYILKRILNLKPSAGQVHTDCGAAPLSSHHFSRTPADPIRTAATSLPIRFELDDIGSRGAGHPRIRIRRDFVSPLFLQASSR
jgi:hypothetical protein